MGVNILEEFVELHSKGGERLCWVLMNLAMLQVLEKEIWGLDVGLEMEVVVCLVLSNNFVAFHAYWTEIMTDWTECIE